VFFALYCDDDSGDSFFPMTVLAEFESVGQEQAGEEILCDTYLKMTVCGLTNRCSQRRWASSVPLSRFTSPGRRG